jgi:hypothetical protein
MVCYRLTGQYHPSLEGGITAIPRRPRQPREPGPVRPRDYPARGSQPSAAAFLSHGLDRREMAATTLRRLMQRVHHADQHFCRRRLLIHRLGIVEDSRQSKRRLRQPRPRLGSQPVDLLRDAGLNRAATSTHMVESSSAMVHLISGGPPGGGLPTAEPPPGATSPARKQGIG